jgi:hypothetical protein
MSGDNAGGEILWVKIIRVYFQVNPSFELIAWFYRPAGLSRIYEFRVIGVPYIVHAVNPVDDSSGLTLVPRAYKRITKIQRKLHKKITLKNVFIEMRRLKSAISIMGIDIVLTYLICMRLSIRRDGYDTQLGNN